MEVYDEKRLLALLLCSVMLLGICACGNDSKDKKEPATSGTESTDSSVDASNDVSENVSNDESSDVSGGEIVGDGSEMGPVFIENKMEGFLNPQYAIDPVGCENRTENMTSFNQMNVGEHMFVVLVNGESQKMLTSIEKSGQVIAKDLGENAYDLDIESEKEGSILRYIWLFYKADENTFQFRPAYATGGRLAVGRDGISVKLEEASSLSAPENKDSWLWNVEELSAQNGAFVAIKSASTGGYLSLDNGSAEISADVSSNPALQWYVLPVFQAVNPYTVYGFARDGSSMPISPAYEGAPARVTDRDYVVHTILSTVTSMTGGGLTYAGGGIEADAFVTKDINKSTVGNHVTQTFMFQSYGEYREWAKPSEADDKEDPQFMMWEINPYEYEPDAPTPFEEVALEAKDGKLVFAEANDSASQRFLILYSMAKDGGYLLVPVSGGADKSFKVYNVNGEALELSALASNATKEQLMWVDGAKSYGNGYNVDLKLTIKDVVVKPVEDAEGKVSYVVDTDKEPLEEYIYDVSLNDGYYDYGFNYFETDDIRAADCDVNKLVIGSIISARAPMYGDIDEKHSGYKYVGYTYTNIVPDNEKNVCYRYFCLI